MDEKRQVLSQKDLPFVTIAQDFVLWDTGRIDQFRQRRRISQPRANVFLLGTGLDRLLLWTSQPHADPQES